MAALNDVSGIVGGSRASFINMLKIWYAKRWDDHVHLSNEIMKLLGKKKGTMNGQFTRAVAVTGLPQSAGINTREGQGLPTARSTTQINPELISRDFYTLLSWTGQAERSAEAGDKAGWARPRQLDQELARKQADINLCRKIFLAHFENLGVVNAYNAGTNVITLEPRNSRTSSGAAYWYHGRHYMRVDQSLGFAATANGAPTYDMESTTTQNPIEQYITAVGGTNAAPTVTHNADQAGLVNPAATNFVIPYKSRANTGNPPWTGTAADEISLFAGFNGIGNICTDDTIYAALYGLARSASTNPTLRGVYQVGNPAGTTRPYEERLLTLLVHTIADEGTGTAPSKAICHNATLREVIAEHDGNKRYAAVQTESGFGKLTAHIGDAMLPYTTDWQCQPGMMIAVDPENWGWIEQSPMGPIDSASERFVSGYDRHEVVWHKSGNFECTTPFGNGIVDDIDMDVYAINS